MKTCICCHQSKPLEDFPNYIRYADGKHRYCKQCHRANCAKHRRKIGQKPHLIQTVSERFWSHVQRCDHGPLCPFCCWEWQLKRDKDGYGRYTIRAGDHMSTSRFAYTIWHGHDVPKHLLVCHTCDNPPCCNPWHLWLGTHADNHRDRDNKGRGAWQQPGAILPRIFGEKHPRAKLQEYQVKEIRQLYTQGISSPKLAAMYKVSKQVILGIIHKRIWKHVT